jgi:hypothetical protein
MPEGLQKDWLRPLLKKLRAWASERFPIPFAVRVYVRSRDHMGDMDGYWTLSEDEDSGIIAISEDLNKGEVVATFLEEWAHARTALLIDEEDDADDPHHHATFWSELGRITVAAREKKW